MSEEVKSKSEHLREQLEQLQAEVDELVKNGDEFRIKQDIDYLPHEITSLCETIEDMDRATRLDLWKFIVRVKCIHDDEPGSIVRVRRQWVEQALQHDAADAPALICHVLNRLYAFGPNPEDYESYFTDYLAKKANYGEYILARCRRVLKAQEAAEKKDDDEEEEPSEQEEEEEERASDEDYEPEPEEEEETVASSSSGQKRKRQKSSE